MKVAEGTRLGLDALLARRRTLTPGECVQLAAAVAEVLAVLHESGQAHGDVRAARVLLDRDGTTHLDDPVGATSVSPSDDIAALGRLIESALDDSAPPLLRRLLATCRSADLANRPSARELAHLVVRTCPATRIRVGYLQPRATRPSLSRVAVVVGVAAATVLGCVALGSAWGSRQAPGAAQLPSAHQVSSAATPPVPRATLSPARPVAVDWLLVLGRLDAARGRAFATGRVRELSAVDSAGSPALRRDTTTLRMLVSRTVVARAWRPRIASVTVQSRTSQRVVLGVRDSLPAYTLVSTGGAVRHRVAARALRWWRVELRVSDGAWRIWNTEAL